MYRPPPLRGQPVLEGKTVLLIDRNQPTRDARVRVLQSHGVEVHAAEDLSGARFLWQPNVYDLILLDVRRHLPGEALEFYERIRAAAPRERFAFLVGPPAISRVLGLVKSRWMIRRRDSGEQPLTDS